MLKSLSAGFCKEDWEVTASEVDVNSWKQQIRVFEGVNGMDSKMLLIRFWVGKRGEMALGSGKQLHLTKVVKWDTFKIFFSLFCFFEGTEK